MSRPARSRVRVDAALSQLRGKGERVTRAREAVLEVLDTTSGHLTADEIVTRAEAAAPGVHRATVYRALATLGDLGLVTHTHLGGSAAVYHLSLPVPDVGSRAAHAHLQCTRCHVLIDIPVESLAGLTAQLDADLGFQLEPQHAALLGLCASCRRA